MNDTKCTTKGCKGTPHILAYMKVPLCRKCWLMFMERDKWTFRKAFGINE